MRKYLRFFGIAILISMAISAIGVYAFLKSNHMLNKDTFWGWTIFFTVIMILLGHIFLSHKFSEGKLQEWSFFFSSNVLISLCVSFIVYTLIKSGFNLVNVDWIGSVNKMLGLDLTFYGIQFIVFVVFTVFYCGFIERDMVRFLFRRGLTGKGKLKTIDSNLENSRWMNKEERNKVFKIHKFSELKGAKKDGIPVMAEMMENGKDMNVFFNSPCHSLIIGSTGSGKTTTFVNPMIQLLGHAGAGSSMIMTDPKGELFSLHSKHLVDNGYDVKVIDLRDTYSSYRWNPLDAIWDMYQKYAHAQDEVYKRLDDVEKTNLEITGKVEDYKNAECWYEFNGKAYLEYDNLINAIKVFKKKTFDEVYEDLNDLVSVLIPIENEKDPMWEKGARAITLATLLAMLEDSEIPELNMVKEKYNFFNLAKILQNSNNDYLELRKYFAGRSPLSKALSLSKQVCDAAENTRASYMSIVYEKLTLFNDSGICALTSSSDFVPDNLSSKKTALFLKIPDEKDTRHNLAAIFILNIYKALIKIASSYEDLSLPRNVYFILDEFGNMPKIEKFDKMITVGRSRKIWFNMIIQSYAQLNNVYGDTVADIVKGNCGIKMFIGSNDMNTCKEYSELCGNITVVTKSTSASDRENSVNVSQQTQVRPLIYPSELQRLNKPGDIGHSIIVTFGNYPFMTYFTPSFKVPLYKIGKMDTSELNERLFDEKAAFYDIAKRNTIISEKQEKAGKTIKDKQEEKKEETTEDIENQIIEEVMDEAEGKLDDKTPADIKKELKQLLKKHKISSKTSIDKLIRDLLKEIDEEVNK